MPCRLDGVDVAVRESTCRARASRPCRDGVVPTQVGDDFRNRSRKFPALVNSTVIDWFQPWPEDALLSVGQRFLGADSASVSFNFST
jgi:hypothetical protein